jgi:predicted NBD/HSP70 family sugar kinase
VTTGFAVDVGGTKIIASTAAADAPTLRAPTPAADGPDAILDQVVELVRRACDGDPGDLGVVATPGPADQSRGVVRAASNLPFRDYPLGPLLERRLGVPVAVVVDTAAAAAAEFLPGGAADGCRTGAYVTISTGIGMAVVTEGRWQSGRYGRAGELGHVPVASGPDAFDCPCGQRGCLEVYASGSGLARLAAPHLPGAAPTAADVVRAARAGLHWAGDLMDEMIRLLTSALAGLIRTLDPEAVVLGGGLLRGADIAGQLRDQVGAVLRATVPEVPEILRVARHGELSPLRGAAALARRDPATLAFLAEPAR